MIDFKTLKPGEAAACNAAAAVDSGAALQAVLCVQDGGVAVDADVDAAMEVIARRATVIEKEVMRSTCHRLMCLLEDYPHLNIFRRVFVSAVLGGSQQPAHGCRLQSVRAQCPGE